MITARLRSNKIAERVRSLNISLMLLVFALISIAAVLTMTRIARTASLRIAHIHSLESLGKFNSYTHGDLSLLRKAARSAAVQEWFAYEHNIDKKLAAYHVLMYFAASLQSTEFYFGITGSLNEYAIDLDTAFEDFAPYGRMEEDDPMDAWFFDLLASDNDFLFNIDVDKIAHRWRIWINYKVVHDGQVVGVLCTSLRIDDVMNRVFGCYDESNIRGFVIDNRGFIHIGSTELVHYSELDDELVHISSINAALGNFFEDFVGGSERFFNADSPSKVIRLPGIISDYAAITPIANSDWMIVTLFNSNALFSVINLLPLVAALVSAFILYMFINSFVMQRYVLKPLTNLTKSVSQINDAGAGTVAVYGGERNDEIGDLSQTIEHMWHTLRTKNLDLQNTALELGKLEKLLHTVNNATAVLLAVTDKSSLRDALSQSMEMIGRCLEADRMQLWHTDMETGEIDVTLSSQWLSELGQQNPHPQLMQKILYGVLLKSETALLQGKCFNGPIANLPAAERHLIESQESDLKSVVIIPVFLHEKLWGFSVIADSANERTLSNEEMNILHSASLMIVSIYQRVELAAAEQETHELNKTIIGAAPYAIGLWDENANLINVSKQAEKMFGIPDPQMLIDDCYHISPKFQPCGTPTLIKAAEQITRAYYEGYRRFDWMHKTADGESLPCEYIFKRFTHKGKTMFLSYTIDLREIKAAEKKEREAQAAANHRERLLDTIKQAAEILLTANEKDTLTALMTSMEIVGRCVDADRVQIWRNEVIDGDLYFVMRYEWLSAVGKQKIEVPIGLKAAYSSRPGWLEMFLRGECINTPISKLPPDEAAFLGYYEMISIVILPLFLDGEFIGFFSIDDCRRERVFTNDEMDMFASAGLMFTNVFNRNAQRELAFTDALTGIGNRRCLMENAEEELRNCIEKNMDFAIIMIDIDHFKSINDRYGHAIGDTVLKILTSRICHALKHDTLVTRYGGEEFVITLSDVNHETAVKTAWRVQKTIEASAFRIEGLEINVTASFGVASKTSDCTTLSDIIDKADKALYQAKRTGRNTVIDYKSIVTT